MKTFNIRKEIRARGATFHQDEKGAITVLMAIMLTMILGFAGLAMDIGNLYVVRTKMQNAVDAAVCGGGLQLPNQGQATLQAQALLTSNNFDPNTATITFTQDAVKNPANDPQINCKLTQNVPTYMLGLFGHSTVPITVSAEAILKSTTPGGAFDYTLFSGSTNNTLSLNGSQHIKGSVHANYRLSINGSSEITGSAEGVNRVNINGANTIGSVSADVVEHISTNGANNIGSESGGASVIDMPDFSAEIAATAAQNYSGNQSFNGNVEVSGSIYVDGNVTLNGSISSTGAILATGNITVNGSSSISGANQVCMYSSGGNITVNGSSFLGDSSSMIIYAPNGTVNFNGSSNFHGRVIANKINVNGSEIFNGEDYPITSLPAGKAHVKLIK